jgi:citrate synthase
MWADSRTSRHSSSWPLQTLKERLKEIIPERVAEVKETRQKFGTKSLGNVTVDMVRTPKRFLGTAK